VRSEKKERVAGMSNYPASPAAQLSLTNWQTPTSILFFVNRKRVSTIDWLSKWLRIA
jgi:hypothetical protein